MLVQVSPGESRLWLSKCNWVAVLTMEEVVKASNQLPEQILWKEWQTMLWSAEEWTSRCPSRGEQRWERRRPLLSILRKPIEQMSGFTVGTRLRHFMIRSFRWSVFIQINECSLIYATNQWSMFCQHLPAFVLFWAFGPNLSKILIYLLMIWQ